MRSTVYIILLTLLSMQGCSQNNTEKHMEYNKLTPEEEELTDTAIFAGGCFWGVEYFMEKAPGVQSAVSGFIGGHLENPTYEDVCSDTSGYYEAVQVTFDPSQISYEQLAKLFFEIHDPTQWNHQGPDVGIQYRSAVFYMDDKQKTITENLIGILTKNGYNVVTELKPASKFYKAEDKHQNYYKHKGTSPSCHAYTKRF